MLSALVLESVLGFQQRPTTELAIMVQNPLLITHYITIDKRLTKVTNQSVIEDAHLLLFVMLMTVSIFFFLLSLFTVGGRRWLYLKC